jgi:hypothetical protein
VYLPKKVGGETFEQEIKPLKTATNYDGFFWETADDIKERVHLIVSQQSGDVSLNIDIATPKNFDEPLVVERAPIEFYKYPKAP